MNNDRKTRLRLRTLSVDVPNDLYIRLERYRLEEGVQEGRFISKGSVIVAALAQLLDAQEVK